MDTTPSTQVSRTIGATVAGLGLLLALVGCSQVRLPRIDPSGERLFLPAGNYTTVVPPNEVVCVPEPAYPAPPAIPDCNQPPPPKPASATRQRTLLHGPRTPRGKKGYLVLMPGKISAPVGTEVVLLAGFCSNDGFLMTDQPIQWTIAPDSVGQFVSSNESSTDWFHRRSDKLEADYALTRTVCTELLLTRGTAKKTDDVTVRRGQSWISVTSPTSGTTHVTVVAPNAENWEQRRKTAVIFWVDAQWQFPAPATARAGEPIRLATRVTRKDGTPIRGWKVRYRLPPGNAVFAETRQAAAEATTDAQGMATVTVQQTTPGPETVAVSMEVLRPEPDGRTLPLGQGATTVHWSAPGLNIRATGPTTLPVGGVATYRMEVNNPGDVAARQVSLSVQLPEGLEFLSSKPEAQLFGRQLQWNLGELAPRATLVVEATCRATAPGDVRWTAVATSADVARMEASVDTRVIPAGGLKARWLQSPQTAHVGDIVEYTLEVQNDSNQPMNEVTVTIQFDEGLQQTEGATSPIRRSLGLLPAGQTNGMSVRYRVLRAGTLRQRVDITSSNGQSVALEAALQATEAPAAPPAPSGATSPPPSRPLPAGASPLEVTIIGDTQRHVGELANYTVTVRNQGSVAVTNIRLAVGFDAALEPTRASGGHTVEAGQLVWNEPRLEPGQSMERKLEFRCKSAAAQAEVRAIAAADNNVRAQDQTTIVILAAGGTAAPPPSPNAGKLEIKVHDVRDPVRIGQRTTYVIQVANRRSTSDRQVQIKIELSPTVTVESVESQLAVVDTSNDGRTLTLEPIKELRPNESLKEIRIEVTAKGPETEASIRVEATSELERRPVVAVEKTTLVMP